jgi:acetoacetate decarboxylase
MLLVIAGLVSIVLATVLTVYCRPQGALARVATMPVVEIVIPLVITSGLALGFAMVVAGLLF